MSMNIRDIKKGQTIKVWREVEVSSVDAYEGLLYPVGGNGAKIRIAKPGYGYGTSTPFNFELVRDVKPAEMIIDHWPPQEGDVWKISTGAEYHATKTSYYSSDPLTMNPTNTYGVSKLTLEQLKNNNPVLTYRKGNSLK